MWSGGISGRNRVRPAGKWARGLTCQTAKTPACHIQIVMRFVLHLVNISTKGTSMDLNCHQQLENQHYNSNGRMQYYFP